MSIVELGSLGEFIGALAVLATLIYLAMQVRQSNRHDRATARQAVLSNYISRSFQTAESPRLTKILRDALADYSNLDPSDKTAFDLFEQFWWGNLYQAILSKEDGLLDDESFAMISDGFIGSIITPGGRDYWQEARKNPSIPKKLVSYVETCLSDPEGLPKAWTESHTHWQSEH